MLFHPVSMASTRIWPACCLGGIASSATPSWVMLALRRLPLGWNGDDPWALKQPFLLLYASSHWKETRATAPPPRSEKVLRTWGDW
jgi:hypothetical protein